MRNILARVTGGATSIDGTLSTAGMPGANFFLLNPRGVFFKANAVVDVSGSFAVIAGDRVGLQDGASFDAVPSASDVLLTSAPPAAFGFLTGSAGPIAFEGSQLQGAEGATWSLVGGEVRMTGASLKTSGLLVRGKELSMDGAKVELATKAPTDQADIQLHRTLSLANGSTFEVSRLTSAAPVANAKFSAREIKVSGSSAMRSFSGDKVRGGNVQIRAGRLVLAEGGRIQASASDSAAGGHIAVAGKEVIVRGNLSAIASDTASAARGGNIRLTLSGDLKLRSGGRIVASTLGAGAGGGVNIVAPDLSLGGFGTAITAETSGTGSGGAVHITLSGKLTITEAA